MKTDGVWTDGEKKKTELHRSLSNYEASED